MADSVILEDEGTRLSVDQGEVYQASYVNRSSDGDYKKQEIMLDLRTSGVLLHRRGAV